MFKVGTKVNLIGDPIIDYWDDCFTDIITIKNGGSLNVEDNLNFLLKNEIMNFKVYMSIAFKRPNYGSKNGLDQHDFLDYHAKLYENFHEYSPWAIDCGKGAFDYNWDCIKHPSHPNDSKSVTISDSWFNPIRYENSILIISNYNKGFLEKNWDLIYKQKKYDNRLYDLIIVDSKYNMPYINDIKELGEKIIIRQSHKDEELKSLDFEPDYFIFSNSKEGKVAIYDKQDKYYGFSFKPIDVNSEPGNDIGAGDVFTACLASYLIKNNLEFDTESLIDIVQKSSDKVRIAIQKSKFTCSLV